MAIHRFRFWAGDRHVDIDVHPALPDDRANTLLPASARGLAQIATLRATLHLRQRPNRVEHRGSLT